MINKMKKTSTSTRLLSLLLSVLMVLSLFSVTGMTASADGETYTITLSPKAAEIGVSNLPNEPVVGTQYSVWVSGSYSGELIITSADDPTVLVPIDNAYAPTYKKFTMPAYNVKIWAREDYYKEIYDYTPSEEDPKKHIKTSKSDPENSETEEHTFGSDYKCIYCGAEAVSHSLVWTEAAQGSRSSIYCSTIRANAESFDSLYEGFSYYIRSNDTLYITKADDPLVFVTKNTYNTFTIPSYDMKAWTKNEYEAVNLQNANVTPVSYVCYKDGTPQSPEEEIHLHLHYPHHNSRRRLSIYKFRKDELLHCRAGRDRLNSR